ncbi:4'-phosphopantetheinyl transferase family protein [Methylobacterium sp. ID0610]|uniref:4'-phosphopantetheinyl transferase family protein n=1 Tax=Methylobacterium carpenticola TaxID=3344827 RepID=UPI00367EBBC3
MEFAGVPVTLADIGPARLGAGAAFVLVARADAVIAGLAPARRALPPDEAARIARFLQPQDRHEREAAHGLLRHLLGAELDRPPECLVLSRDAYDRPFLPEAHDLDLNLSHGAGWVAVGLARAGRIGVDVEGADRPVDWDAVARQFLHPAELAAYRSMPAAHRPARALELWSVKEAFVKASGEGFSAAPRTLCLTEEAGTWSLAHRGRQLRAWSTRLPDGARFAWAGEAHMRFRVVAARG